MKKRFIAGAVCPRCSELDKIVMYEKDGINHRECVECGYQDEMPVAGLAHEITTRVTEKPAPRQASEQVINIIDPKEE